MSESSFAEEESRATKQPNSCKHPNDSEQEDNSSFTKVETDAYEIQVVVLGPGNYSQSSHPRRQAAMAENMNRTVEYVLFDMDGLMIDSERIYTIATNAVLGRFGKEMTWDIKAGCMGKPEREAGIHTMSFFPDIPISVDEYLAERNRVQDTLWSSAKLLPGVHKLVTHLKMHNIPMAVATSSRRRNFEKKTAHLQAVFSVFEGKIICGDDEHYKMRGKPAPDIFLIVAKALLDRDVGEPEAEVLDAHMEERAKGLVFEDALPGLQAGKRAGMSVVWVPDQNLLQFGYPVDEMADSILGSLEDFKPEEWGLPPYSTEAASAEEYFN